MKVTHASDQSLVTQGLGQSQEFTIKTSASAFRLLSSALYTNKVRAVLREIGCNGVDAHVLNGKQDTPIDVKMPNRLDGNFYIRDYGPGLSHDQVMQLYTTYFDSTKQASDEFIGGFGVGSKSPFSYTDSFTVISIHNGVRNTYLSYLEDDIPKVAHAAGPEATDEPSGLQVGFPIKPEDNYKFEQEAVEVFSAFDKTPRFLGVDINVDSRRPTPITTNIARNPRFRRHESTVKMGGVRYKLELTSEIQAKISPAAKFLLNQSVEMSLPIGAVSVAASRETLQWDRKSIAAFPGLLDKLVDECRNKFAEYASQVAQVATSMEKVKQLKEIVPEGEHHFWGSCPPGFFDEREHQELANSISSRHYVMSRSDLKHTHLWRFSPGLNENTWKMARVNDPEARPRWIGSIRRSDSKAPTNYSKLPTYMDSSNLFGGKDRPFEAEWVYEAPVHAMVLDTPTSPESIIATYAERYRTLKPLSGKYSTRVLEQNTFVVAPKSYYDDQGQERPPTAAEHQAFLDECAQLKKDYALEWTPVTPLAAFPKKVRANNRAAAPERSKHPLWVGTLRTMSTQERTRMARFYSKADFADAALPQFNAPLYYMTYDRAGDKVLGMDNRAHETSLQKCYHKVSKYFGLSDNTLKAVGLNRAALYSVALVDVADEARYKETAPNALDVSALLTQLEQNKKLRNEHVQWFKEYPARYCFSYQTQQWRDLGKKVIDEMAPGMTGSNQQRALVHSGLANAHLLVQTILHWNDRDWNNDTEREQLMERALLAKIAWGVDLSLDEKQDNEKPIQDIEALKKAYPLLEHLNHKVPSTLLREYVQERDQAYAAQASPVDHETISIV